MTPQEKIILAVAEVLGIVDYYIDETNTDDYIDTDELNRDMINIKQILDEVLDTVHKTYYEKETVSHSD